MSKFLKILFKSFAYGTEEIKGKIGGIFVLNTVYDTSPILFNVIWAYLIDIAINGINTNTLTFNLLLIPFILFASLEIAKNLMKRISLYLENLVYDSLELKVQTDLTSKYSSLDIQSVEDPKVNQLFQSVKSGHDWQLRSMLFTIGELISSIVLILVSVFILINISPVVVLIVIVTTLPSLYVNTKFSSIGWGIYLAEGEVFRKFNLVKDFLFERDNLIEANINKVTPKLVGVIREILQNYHNKRRPLLKRRALYMGAADLCKVGGIICGIYFLINRAVNGAISVGSLILGATTFIALTPAFSTFLEKLTYLYSATLYMENYLRFIYLEPSMKNGSVKVGRFDTPPTIEFKNVKFKYPNTERYILNDLSLKIMPEMKVALVGENGAGKTTLIKVLARFYDVQGGQILINNVPLENIEAEGWKSNLGLLTQHFNTYRAFSLKENIYFGNTENALNENGITDAAKKAKVTKFLDNYKDKYDQKLSAQFEGGIDPSWGQWQRIGIARTLYRNAPIIILDEPTSAIDAQAEHEIFQSINRETAGKTVIYVSHRYSTVREADLICVISQGKIAEQGTHDELMHLNGTYAKNFILQAKGYN